MQIRKKINFLSDIIILFSSMISIVAWGQVGAATSIGDVSGSIFEVGMTVKEIVRAIFIIAGSGLILASLLQYKKYRQNPVEVTWGTVLFTFIVGVAVICLSFIPISL